jgi:Protein of unknown function (DUF3572)
MTKNRGVANGRAEAEALGVSALTYLAGQPDWLGRFLSLAGIGPTSLRGAAADPAFLAGVLDFMLDNEGLLIAFAKEVGVPPGRVGEVRRFMSDEGNPET